jgi:hypothetical protein
MRVLPALMLTLCALPADMARAGGDGPVLEVVSFRLIPGTPEADFLAAARATEPPLRLQRGFLSRQLTRSANGTWTDHVAWASLPMALAASEAMMAEPAFQPFMALIDGASLQMRHDQILWQVD